MCTKQARKRARKVSLIFFAARRPPISPLFLRESKFSGLGSSDKREPEKKKGVGEGREEEEDRRGGCQKFYFPVFFAGINSGSEREEEENRAFVFGLRQTHRQKKGHSLEFRTLYGGRSIREEK